MLNFTVGPVQMFERTLAISSQQVPYFRTAEFSEIMKYNERQLLELFDAPDDSRIAFVTGSGTSAMEASLINCLHEDDKVLVVNGGGFGARFVHILRHYGYHYEELPVEQGDALYAEQLDAYRAQGFTSFVVNLNETSTSTLYDLQLIAQFCKDEKLFLIVDAVSAFLSDPISMKESGIDLIFTGSQKALALAPGMAFVALAPSALSRIHERHGASVGRTSALNIPFYLDFYDMLDSGVRGQTPYTPAVSVLLQLHDRLHMIEDNGGVQSELNRVKAGADYFRAQIAELDFSPFSVQMGHAVTALRDPHNSAMELFNTLKNEHNIWICPNSGSLAQEVFRVGHLGNLQHSDYDCLLAALKTLRKA